MKKGELLNRRVVVSLNRYVIALGFDRASDEIAYMPGEGEAEIVEYVFIYFLFFVIRISSLYRRMRVNKEANQPREAEHLAK